MGIVKKLEAGELLGLKSCTLSSSLWEFPREILDLSDTLEVLDLSHNQLSSLPDDFNHLEHLRILFLGNNNFENIPKVLSQSDNQIEWLFEMKRLSWLALSNNPFTYCIQS